MRRAATAVELLIAVAVSGVVLFALLALWRGGMRMARAAEGSSLLTSAMVLEEALTQDLRGMGVDPDRRDTFFASDAALSFYRVRFEGVEVRLRPVRWAAVPRAGGVSLVRTERDAAGKLATQTFGQGALASVRFALVGDRDYGNRYVRVDLVLRDREELAHALLVRVPAPSGLGNPALAVAGRVVPEADLLTLK